MISAPACAVTEPTVLTPSSEQSEPARLGPWPAESPQTALAASSIAHSQAAFTEDAPSPRCPFPTFFLGFILSETPGQEAARGSQRLSCRWAGRVSLVPPARFVSDIPLATVQTSRSQLAGSVR